ncbi:MAG: MFS transporter [Candidatus Omnitrophota bacterium]
MRSSSCDRRAVFSWCLYDFANSPFTTLVVTFIYATYFIKAFAADENMGTVLWSRGVTITALASAMLSPFLGAIADRGGFRKAFLFFFTAVAAGGSAMLYTIMPGRTSAALFWFVTANIAFEMGEVFYNAFLPDIAPPEKIGRISGYGWAMGYMGGLMALLIAFAGFVQPSVPWFGFSKELGENIRATNLLVAVWYALFCIPIFLWVKEDRSRACSGGEKILASSVKQLIETFHEIRRYRQIVRLLAARLFYNDGLITIFAFSGIYAKGTFHFADSELLILAICLNIAAGLGAYAMGFWDDRLGGKRTVLISLAGLTLAVIFAVAAQGKAMLWIGGLLAGIFSGPNQSASRSLMGRFVPTDKENEFFGFFAFSGKATAFLGPFLFGVLTQTFASQRAGVAAIIVFFIIGACLLAKVDEAEGLRCAGRSA